MKIYDPSTLSRQHESGYKGDGWTVTQPAEGSETILMLDTGMDSVAIARIPNGKWDRGLSPRAVHAHTGYDETVLVYSGSGNVFHGPSEGQIICSRLEGPAVVVFPSGTWHHIVMDPLVDAIGTCFFTIPGTVIAKFVIQMEVVHRGRVSFADLAIAQPNQVNAAERTRVQRSSKNSAKLVSALPSGVSSGARILPYPPPADGVEYVLPLDSGHDSLFIMASQGEERKPAVQLPIPEFVDVHSHPDVDEYIIRNQGAGFLLNGPSPETITLTPFSGSTVIVMPAGGFHRIVQTVDEGGDSSRNSLIYTDRRAVVDRYDVIMDRTSVAMFPAGRIVGE